MGKAGLTDGKKEHPTRRQAVNAIADFNKLSDEQLDDLSKGINKRYQQRKF